jgi:uncharacterized delta-60 repeat protein
MMRKLFSILTAFFIFSMSFSQNLVVDTNFGSAGKVITSFGPYSSIINSLTLQNDGKIIACGSYYSGDYLAKKKNQIALARYNVDGNLDVSFGNDGKVLTPLGIDMENEYNSVQVLDNGKIMVAATNGIMSSGYDFAIVQYNADGTLDTNFGTNGIVITDFNTKDNEVRSLITLPNHKFIVGGEIYINSSNGYTDFAVARYNENGTLDTTFGNNGLSSVNIGTTFNSLYSSEDWITNVKLLPNGKIIAVGTTSNNYSNEKGGNFGMIRLNENGSLDTNFGINGRVITDFGGDEGPTSLQILNDGKIIVNGIYYYNDDENEKVVIAKYNENGTLDTTYGSNGKIMTDFETVNKGFVWSNEIQNDGKMLVFGWINKLTADYVIFRYNTNGSLDTTFGTNGIQTIDFGENESVFASITQPDGKIILGGTSNFDVDGGFSLLRLKDATLSTNTLAESKNSFLVYPNPFVNAISVALPQNIKENISIDLLDNMGRKITTFLSNELFIKNESILELEMPESLSKGVYFLKIIDGERTTTIKVVK